MMFNCRVVGVCIKDNRIFLSKMKNDAYWTFVGGKVAMGESSAEAIVRECREELGVTLQADRLAAVIENFFQLDGRPWHQYIFLYQLRDDDGVLELFEGERELADERNAVYKWFELSELRSVEIKPDCAVEAIEKMSGQMLHYINRE